MNKAGTCDLVEVDQPVEEECARCSEWASMVCGLCDPEVSFCYDHALGHAEAREGKQGGLLHRDHTARVTPP